MSQHFLFGSKRGYMPSSFESWGAIEVLSIQSSETKWERKREENECCICLLPGCHCFVISRCLIYLFSEVELHTKTVAYMMLRRHLALSCGHWIVTGVGAIFKVQVLESWIWSVSFNQPAENICRAREKDDQILESKI